ncbi:MAG: hypothetical protein R3F11_21205 [Verrucomicrobiales bacterium]
MALPEKVAGDWGDIPKPGINYKTSKNMQMDEGRQRKAVAGYYASVAYMDAQVGKVLDALRRQASPTDDHDLHQRPRLPPRRARLLGEGQPARENPPRSRSSSGCPGSRPPSAIRWSS